MIRRAVPADTDKIMSLWFRENAAAHSFIPRRFWENCAEMVRTELLPAAETFVFCDKRQIKGFISLLNGDYVGALFVREDCQGKGIGLRLLEYVRRRRPRLSLHANIRNAGALCFYRRCGFKIVAESVNEQTQEPEVLLVWSRGCLSGCRNRFPGDS